MGISVDCSGEDTGEPERGRGPQGGGSTPRGRPAPRPWKARGPICPSNGLLLYKAHGQSRERKRQ